MAQAKDKDAKDDKDEKDAKTAVPEAPEPKPGAFGSAYGGAFDAVDPQVATVAESALMLRDFVKRMEVRLAKGSKSDLDKTVPLLALIGEWIDLLLANVPDPPPQTQLARFDD